MSIYQRYLSKSLIVFSSLLFLIVFLLESNFGFKLFFNTTNHFLWGLKFEEISGNWRDFKLKNITFNFFGISMKASNIRVLVNPISLFKVHKIFKKIETKNLILSFNKTNLIALKKEDFKKNILKNNIFFNKNVIFKEIYSDKILIKSRILNILLSNFHSGLKFINNNFTIFNTDINFIQFNIKKNNKKYLLNKKNFLSQKDINNYLLHFLNNKMLLLPININLTSIKCKKIKFFHQQLKNILFKGRLNNQFIFKLKCNDFIKFNLFVKVLLNSLNHPIYINFHVNRFTFPIKKK